MIGASVTLPTESIVEAMSSRTGSAAGFSTSG